MSFGVAMLPFLSAKREAGWMAVVQRGDRLDLAHVVRAGLERPALRLLDSYRLETNAADALARLRAARGLKAYRCTTLLANGEYQLAQLEAPDVPLAERREAVRWRLKDVVDFAVDTASVDVLDIPLEGAAGARQASVFAVAAPAAAVGPAMARFDAAKVPLAAIDIPELAQRNVAALFEEPNRGLAFFAMDEQGGLLTLTWRGELYAIRRVDISAKQLAEAAPERCAELLERVGLELQRSLDNFDRQYGFISVSGMVVASYPAVEALTPYLAENMYLPVREMDLRTVLDCPAQPELASVERQAQCLLAIGAALRGDAGGAA